MTEDAHAAYDAVIEDHELKSGHFKRCQIGSEDILLCRLSPTGVFAIRNRCSHMDKPMHEGRLIGHRLSCPEHGAEFDVRTGAALSFPATRPLVRFEVELRDGRILVSREPAPTQCGPRSS